MYFNNLFIQIVASDGEQFSMDCYRYSGEYILF